jgi:hypothetical protein
MLSGQYHGPEAHSTMNSVNSWERFVLRKA